MASDRELLQQPIRRQQSDGPRGASDMSEPPVAEARPGPTTKPGNTPVRAIVCSSDPALFDGRHDRGDDLRYQDVPNGALTGHFDAPDTRDGREANRGHAPPSGGRRR